MSDTDGGDDAEEEPNPFCDDETETSSIPDEFEPSFRSWGIDGDGGEGE